MRASPAVLFAVIVPALTALGCGGTPSAANIKLRKELQRRDEQIDRLQKQHQADLADLRARSGLTSGSTTGPTTDVASAAAALSPDMLARLFTVHGLAFGRLTGGSGLDANKPGDQGLKIFVVPTDDEGQPLKAAGAFSVEAFDLSVPDNVIGKWSFDTAATRQCWNGAALLYTYVLTCPWQTHVPTHSSLTVRVTFHDELTGREFSEQRIVTINPPPASH